MANGNGSLNGTGWRVATVILAIFVCILGMGLPILRSGDLNRLDKAEMLAEKNRILCTKNDKMLALVEQHIKSIDDSVLAITSTLKEIERKMK